LKLWGEWVILVMVSVASLKTSSYIMSSLWPAKNVFHKFYSSIVILYVANGILAMYIWLNHWPIELWVILLLFATHAILMLGMFVYPYTVVSLAKRSSRRVRMGRCAKCDYPVRDGRLEINDICPECGWVFDEVSARDDVRWRTDHCGTKKRKPGGQLYEE